MNICYSYLIYTYVCIYNRYYINIYLSPIRSFNPNLSDIMMTLNQFDCKHHPEETLTIKHLETEHGIVENMNNYFLRGSDCEKRDLVEGYHRFSDLLSNLKGEKKYSRRPGGRGKEGIQN